MSFCKLDRLQVFSTNTGIHANLYHPAALPCVGYDVLITWHNANSEVLTFALIYRICFNGASADGGFLKVLWCLGVNPVPAGVKRCAESRDPWRKLSGNGSAVSIPFP